MKNLAICIFACIFSSCATKISTSNFRELSLVKEDDIVFYAAEPKLPEESKTHFEKNTKCKEVRYRDKNCIDIDFSLANRYEGYIKCKESNFSGSDCNSVVFSSTKKLNINSYTITMNDGGVATSRENQLAQDMLILVAAEVAKQQRFDKIIVNKIKISSHCGSVPTSTTTGTYSDSTFSSNTTYSSYTSCGRSGAINILAFNDYQEIKDGVFVSEDKLVKWVKPYYPLYNSRRAELGNAAKIDYSPPWKSYYDVNDMIYTLSNGYQIAQQTNLYNIKKMSEQNGTNYLNELKKTE